ncbi:hypothetical protein D7W82_05875 [Corallococcus sp. CA049B]|uniref:hypothetical protein n=1 Tax=Corallococcus sp. CA049B TaxID=2316730 RepID=UPI000EA2B251|nr:hypothetical protein [Corallococcus sp. CA049B]RKG89815.1 hypothetical protein D7W82_05875 [Corallococcus sp. CA049B]
MATLKQLAFRMARTPASGSLVRFGFAHADRLLPLTSVDRSEQAALYRHPRPVYGTFHHIAVPLRGVPDVFALAHPRHAGLHAGLFALIAAARQRTRSATALASPCSRTPGACGGPPHLTAVGDQKCVSAPEAWASV